jgi:hypothetical protein
VQSTGASTPTGTVTFKDGTTTLGTGTLSGGVATFTSNSLVPRSTDVIAHNGRGPDVVPLNRVGADVLPLHDAGSDVVPLNHRGIDKRGKELTTFEGLDQGFAAGTRAAGPGDRLAAEQS